MLLVPVGSDVIQKFSKEGQITDIPEIRVWVHPPSGSDHYKVFDSFLEAKKFIAKHPNTAEDIPLLAWRGWEFNLFDDSVISHTDDIEKGWNLAVKALELFSTWADEDPTLKGYFTRLIKKIKEL